MAEWKYLRDPRVIRRSLLVLVLAGCLAAWLFLLWLQRSYEHAGANYSRIEDRLYAGGAVERPPSGTGAVLNLCEQEDPYRCRTHVWEPIRDAEPAPDLDWLRRQVDWVDARRGEGATVFVHCRNGVSRSALVVTAYEMRQKLWTRDEALAFVRSKRPVARPNRAFMQLLLEWERVLKEQGPAAGE
jgi:hypothetical protein